MATNPTYQVKAIVANVLAQNNVAYAYTVHLAKSPVTKQRDLRIVPIQGIPKATPQDIDLRAKLYDGIVAALKAAPIKARVDMPTN
jgi:hypothetical protein